MADELYIRSSQLGMASGVLKMMEFTVEAALLDVIATHGGRDEDAARDYLATLQQQGRYARDVY